MPLEIKERRNQELLQIQKRIARENNEKWIGAVVDVFVEGRSPKNQSELIGRTGQDKKVVFAGDKSLIGSFQKVTLKNLKHETFVGETSS